MEISATTSECSKWTKEQALSTESFLYEKKKKLLSTRNTYILIMQSLRDEMIKVEDDLESIQQPLDDVRERLRELENIEREVCQADLEYRFNSYIDSSTILSLDEKIEIKSLFVFSPCYSSRSSKTIFMEHDRYMGPNDQRHVRLTCGIYYDITKFSLFCTTVGARVYQGCTGNFISYPEEEMFDLIVRHYTILRNE